MNLEKIVTLKRIKNEMRLKYGSESPDTIFLFFSAAGIG